VSNPRTSVSSTTWSEGLAICLATVSDAKDQDGLCFVVDFEEKPVVTDPDTPAIGGSAQLGDAGRPRVLFKSWKGSCDARADLGRELPAVAFCRSAEQNAVRRYGVSPVSDSSSRRGLGESASALASSTRRRSMASCG